MPLKRSGESDSSTSGAERPKTLDEARKRIDEVDAELSALLCERFLLSLEVAQIKAGLNLGIKDQAREQAVLDRVGAASNRRDIAAAIQAVYQNIFACSRKLQHREDPIESAAAASSQAPSAGSASQNRNLVFPQVTIIGLGLIGGAMAHLLRRHLPATEIIGCDLDETSIKNAIASEIIDDGGTDVVKSISQSSLIVLAASPETNLALLKQIAPLLDDGQIVIDVSSAKSNIVELARQLKLSAVFIGGHPLFGTEKSGFDASAAVTTDGAMFCLSPASEASEFALVRLIEWLSLLNLRAQVVDAKAHDQVLARTSHVIQFLTIALGVELSYLAERIGMQQISSLAGPSVKQMGRLMKSPSQMWCEIADQNKTEVVDALNSLAETLHVLSSAIEAGDKPAIKALFDRAREIGITLHGE